MPSVYKQLLKLKGLVFTGVAQFCECLKVPLMVDRDAVVWSEGLMSPYYWYGNIRPGERVGQLYLSKPFANLPDVSTGTPFRHGREVHVLKVLKGVYPELLS
jgi:hypothetical protein